MKLVKPNIQMKESFLESLEGSWRNEIECMLIELDFQSFVNLQLSKPETELWAEVEGKYAGRITIRHEPNEDEGHIGYDVVPAFRNQGIATKMLTDALSISRPLGLNSLILICDETNVASIRVIEKNGGILQESKALKRYYSLS